MLDDTASATPPDLLARRLAEHGDYRVLRRLAPVKRFHVPVQQDGQSLSIGAVVDVETTGLDREADRIIELAVQRFRFDALGRITEVGQPRVWREDPGRPLDMRITKLTGLTDADLSGQAIDETMALSILGSADVVIAHNAGFDRPFVEKRLPQVAGKPWACSMADLDWLELGFDGRALAHLVAQCGWFYEGHRAENDVLALLYLLAHQLADGETVLKKLIACAEAPSWRVHAVESPFEAKDRLKARGYRWDAVMKYWWKEVADAELAAEQAWLAAEIYAEWGEPAVHPVTWRERHR